ncbi:MAG: T9SS type A sorting domain-containing protein [Bacteroidetes bacterium]|nr:T9SS type A sorting domain-containing protein [Bacteroidota bacterium]
MKTSIFRTALLVFIWYVQGYSQKIATILPSTYDVIPLAGNIEPMKQTLDSWNFSIQNITVENWSDPEMKKLQDEKTKQKLLQNENKSQENQMVPQATSTVTPVAGKSFSGSTNGLPPFDNGTAVSNGKYIVQMINKKILITDTLGTSLYSNSLGSFFGFGTSPFDPRVIYDSYSDRFIVIAIPGTLKIHVAFSATNDPTGKWYKYNITAPNESGFLDYPFAGVTDKDLLFTTFVVGNDHSRIYQVSKTDGYNGKPLRMETYLPSTNSVWVCVAGHGRSDTPYGNKAYLVSSRTGNKSLHLVEITDTIGGNPLMNIYSIPVPIYYAAGKASQKGSSILLSTTAEARMLSAVFCNGIVHCVHNTDQNNNGYNVIGYYRINVNTKTATPYYFSQPNSDVCYPSVALFGSSQSDKTVVIGYQESNKNIYPSLSAVVCDDTGNWSLPIKLKEGLGTLGGSSRYGDYSSITRKHNAEKPTAWFSGEYGGQGNIRSCWISQITTIGTLTSVSQFNENNSLNIYPNPLIEQFTLSFDIEKMQTEANICIYNMEGQLVKMLFEGPLMAGKNEMRFDKTALASGVYFLRIKGAQELLQNKKIIINQ